MENLKKAGMFFCISILSCYFLHGAENDNISIRIAKYKGDRICAISYTFDDGLKEHYTLAAPELEKRNFRGTFWINGAQVNEDENAAADTTRAAWANLKKMTAAGHEISNHGWSHKNLTKITIDEVRNEIEKNDRIILEKIGVPSRTFCYPYNAKNEEILQLASKNRVGTRTKQFDIGGDKSKSTPEKLDEKMTQLMQLGEWGVAMIHGITYGYDAFFSPEILWKHFDKVKANDDKIWVGTFREVAAYIAERENTGLNIEKEKNRIVITPESSLDKELFTESLTLVIEQKNLKKIKAKQGKKKLPVQICDGKAIFDFDPHGNKIYVSVKY